MSGCCMVASTVLGGEDLGEEIAPVLFHRVVIGLWPLHWEEKREEYESNYLSILYIQLGFRSSFVMDMYEWFPTNRGNP